MYTLSSSFFLTEGDLEYPKIWWRSDGKGISVYVGKVWVDRKGWREEKEGKIKIVFKIFHKFKNVYKLLYSIETPLSKLGNAELHDIF